MKANSLFFISIILCSLNVKAGVPTESQCPNYKVTRNAAITALAEPTYVCSDMMRDEKYSSLNFKTFFDKATGRCMLSIGISGVVNGNSKTCNVTRKVKEVEDGKVTFIE
ncbi:hypothetical protein VC188_11465 [Polynucleobacter sp. MG-28-Ekke-A2]|uniref:hypothetical protein n=1 Tax=Polynucleobacter sp. MG-28-Ekke-A2 TaxID=3108276 RepID=UPI002B2355BB|nr:hypothetical protein [Polynucleobacter sp. MG-28-Ekke-A2]MEA9602733.1 hypothetical protein [Polynucleobacter sp. MG-28-Ekke-A2]